jgi:hypothetical protein
MVMAAFALSTTVKAQDVVQRVSAAVTAVPSGR